eukprot:CAMPEP_0116864556 /NCGR_PEP_ID=MMETSP0418-20121206/24889_1 /TAXON_ID=1158023 /ORGANISM="Astrosyne radiata, Strain 13vi08-1A" /LENGTH=261 /DNA_ID=CAMNT_0004499793 /DNA_START=29 /DNA_END=814 /DNA_ORIENTATION=-
MEAVEKSCRVFVRQMIEFDHQTYLVMLLPLSGEAMNYNQYCEAVKGQNHTLALQLVDFTHLVLAVLFQDTDFMVELLPRLERGVSALQTHFTEYLLHVYMALAYHSLYRRERKASYRRKVSSKVKIMQKWVNAGVENCRPFLYLLLALQKSERRKGTNKMDYATVKSSFDDAIKMLGDGDWVVYEAMATEQFGFIALDQKDRLEASRYMTRAVDLFQQHCYHAKAEWTTNQLRVNFLDDQTHPNQYTVTKSHERQDFNNSM